MLTPEQIEAHRAKFEAKFPEALTRYDQGVYVNPYKQMQFNAWLAAVESVEVEIPTHVYSESDWCDGYDKAMDDVEELLEKQGLKFKRV